MSATTTTTSTDGTSIAYDRSGQGPAVVLIGGGPAERSANAGLAVLLAEQLTVYNYDRRGRGESSTTDPYHPDREFDDLAAVITAAGGTAAVYGSSGAGIIALDAAARGLAINAVAVWEPPYDVDGNGPSVSPDWGDRIDELVTAGHRGDAVAHWLTEVVKLPRDFVTPMRQSPFWLAMEAQAHGLVHDAALLRDFTMPAERIAKITAPTLVLDGGAAAWPTIRDAAAAVVAVVPHAERRSIDGQPHNVAPDAIAPVLTEFFTRAAAGGTR